MGTIRKITTKSGQISFHVEIRLKGFKEMRTFRTITLAKNWIQKTEAAIRDGKYKSISSSRQYTVKDLLERFISETLPKAPKYYEKKVQLLERWKHEIGSIMLCDLSSSHIVKVRDKLLSEKTAKNKLRTPSTVNRYLAAFSKAMAVAVKEWDWIDENPMKKV